MKHDLVSHLQSADQPAAFSRLCVETISEARHLSVEIASRLQAAVCLNIIRRCGTKKYAPAAFRRLCVETLENLFPEKKKNPAAFRRLCVETIIKSCGCDESQPAAFRRLCVETLSLILSFFDF